MVQNVGMCVRRGLAYLSVLIGLFAISGCASVSSVGDTIAESIERPGADQVGRAKDKKLMEFSGKLWAPFYVRQAIVEDRLSGQKFDLALQLCDQTLKELATHYEDCGKDCRTLAGGGYYYDGYWPDYHRFVRTFSEYRIKALVGLNRMDEAYVGLSSFPSPSPPQVLFLGLMAFDRGEYATATHAYEWLEDYRLRTPIKGRDAVGNMALQLLDRLTPGLKGVSDRIPQDDSVPVRHCLKALIHVRNAQPAAALSEADSCVKSLSRNPQTLSAANSFVPGRSQGSPSTWTDTNEMARLTLERAHRERGKLLLAIGRLDEAILDLSRPGVQYLVLVNDQVDTGEKEPISQYLLALAREAKGEYALARQLLLNMDGSVGRMQWGVNNGSDLTLSRWIALARVSLHLGPQSGARPDDAVKFIDQALKLAPNDAEVLWGAIRAYHAAGNVGRAKEYLVELRRVNPVRASQIEGLF